MEATRLRFGNIEFDADSGVVRHLDRSDRREVRLAPQPARLLALIVRARGDLVTHETIRAHVWPDVEVEFDKSLHFCIRQIRAALGDSAAAPRFIETLPKRGYRLLAPIDRSTDAPSPRSNGDGRRWAVVFMFGAILVTLAILISSVLRPPMWRIGVMPFEPDVDRESNAIAETVLEELARVFDQRAWIVGPSTTSSFVGGDSDLRAMATELDLDYIVNARFLDEAHRGGVLAELIRSSDGAHVWVERFDDLSDERQIASAIVDGVRTGLLGPNTTGADDRSRVDSVVDD